MQIQFQTGQTEIIIAVGSVFMNLMGFVWGAAKISTKLSNLSSSNTRLWDKMDRIERTVTILWDRSERRTDPIHERKDD